MDFDNSRIDGFSCTTVEKSTVFQPVFPWTTRNCWLIAASTWVAGRVRQHGSAIGTVKFESVLPVPRRLCAIEQKPQR